MAYKRNQTISDAWEVNEEPGVYNLSDRLMDFSVNIIRVSRTFENSEAAQHISNQLLRAGTSPMANHAEAQSAESKKDFIHKMKICLKELRETERWLSLARRVPLVQASDALDKLLEENNQLIRIFAKSIQTAQANQQSHKR